MQIGFERSFKMSYINYMPWETKFNIEDTLEKALHVFWEYGYNATSMRDLTKCMGINSGSLYKTFGNKRELFLSTLDYYNKISVERLQKFKLMDSPKQGIISFFEHIKMVTLDQTEKRGCFVVNTILEMAPHDKEMNVLVSKGQDIMRNFFTNLIIQSQKMKEVNKNVDAADTSELLLGLLLGTRVLTRNNPTEKQFNIIIKNVKLILNS